MNSKKLSISLSPVTYDSSKGLVAYNNRIQSKQKLKLKRLSINFLSVEPPGPKVVKPVVSKQQLTKNMKIVPFTITIPKLSPAEVKKYRYKSSITEIQDGSENIRKQEENNNQPTLSLNNNKTIKHSCLNVSKSKSVGNNKMNITLSKLEKKELRGMFSNTSSIAQLCVSVTTATKKRTFRAYTTQTVMEASTSNNIYKDALGICKPVQIKLTPVNFPAKAITEKADSDLHRNKNKDYQETTAMRGAANRRRSLRIASAKTCCSHLPDKLKVSNKHGNKYGKHSEKNLSVSLAFLSPEAISSALAPVTKRKIGTPPVFKTSLSIALTSISPKDITNCSDKRPSDEVSNQRKTPRAKFGKKGRQQESTKVKSSSKFTKMENGKDSLDVGGIDTSGEKISIKMARATTKVLHKASEYECGPLRLKPLEITLSSLSPELISEATPQKPDLENSFENRKTTGKFDESIRWKYMTTMPTTIKKKKTVVVEVFDSDIVHNYDSDVDNWQPRRSKRLASQQQKTSLIKPKYTKYTAKSAQAKATKDTGKKPVSGASKRKKKVPVRRKIDFGEENPLLYAKSKKRRKTFDCFEYLSSPEDKLKATFKRIKKSGSEHQAYVKNLNVSLERINEENIDSESPTRKTKYSKQSHKRREKQNLGRHKVRENIFDKFNNENSELLDGPSNKSPVYSNGDQADNVSVSSANTVRLVLNQDFDVHHSEPGFNKKTLSRKRRSVRNKVKVIEERKKRSAEHKLNIANQMNAFLQAIDDLEVLSGEHEDESSACKGSEDLVVSSIHNDVTDEEPAIGENTITKNTVQVKKDMVDDILYVVHNIGENEPETSNSISDFIANFLKQENCEVDEPMEGDYNVHANPDIPSSPTNYHSEEINFPSDEYVSETPQTGKVKTCMENNNFLLESPNIPLAVSNHQSSYIDPVICDDLNYINQNDLVNDDLYLNSENAMNDILETILNSRHGDLMHAAELDLECESDTDV